MPFSFSPIMRRKQEDGQKCQIYSLSKQTRIIQQIYNSIKEKFNFFPSTFSYTKQLIKFVFFFSQLSFYLHSFFISYISSISFSDQTKSTSILSLSLHRVIGLRRLLLARGGLIFDNPTQGALINNLTKCLFNKLSQIT